MDLAQALAHVSVSRAMLDKPAFICVTAALPVGVMETVLNVENVFVIPASMDQIVMMSAVTRGSAYLVNVSVVPATLGSFANHLAMNMGHVKILGTTAQDVSVTMAGLETNVQYPPVQVQMRHALVMVIVSLS